MLPTNYRELVGLLLASATEYSYVVLEALLCLCIFTIVVLLPCAVLEVSSY